MPKFRKKPVIIEAEQFVVYSQSENPTTKTVNGIVFPIYKDERGFHVFVPTINGTVRADNLDYIVEDVKGHPYPCKPDIFESTHEKVD